MYLLGSDNIDLWYLLAVHSSAEKKGNWPRIVRLPAGTFGSGEKCTVQI